MSTACHAVENNEAIVRPIRFSLHDACERDDLEKLESLIAASDAALAADAVAAATGNAPSAETASLTLDLNERDSSGCTPLHVAALWKSSRCFSALCSRNIKFSLKCNGTPLVHILIAMSTISTNIDFTRHALKLILQQPNFDTLATDDERRTWIHACASASVPIDFFDALYTITPSAVWNPLIAAVDRRMRTALHIAATVKSKEICLWLLEHGADKLAKDMEDNTPAHSAARVGWSEGIELLKTETDVRNIYQLTPLDELHLSLERVPPIVGGVSVSTQPSTFIITHETCTKHRTCPPITRQVEAKGIPPENTVRLDTLLSSIHGTLRADDIVKYATFETSAPPALMTDILRVHDYNYIRRLLTAVGSLDEQLDQKGEVKHLDGDTAVSKDSWNAAIHAAGAVCAAIDRVIMGEFSNGFCVVRPPGHHAGPTGVVTCENDTDGSYGFCLLNNVAIGAAYAKAMYGRQNGFYGLESKKNYSMASMVMENDKIQKNLPIIRKICIFDFDVHHGNGTEAILKGLYPSELVETIPLRYGMGAFSTMVYRPWLDTNDGNEVMFISTHGFGTRDPANPAVGGWFYPGSGSNSGWNTDCINSISNENIDSKDKINNALKKHSDENTSTGSNQPKDPHGRVSTHSFQAKSIPEHLYEKDLQHPMIINVSVPHGSKSSVVWRRILTLDVLPRIANFKPDLILVSAGFDAHVKDTINCGYVGLREDDYSWITKQLLKIANVCANGRLVSVLEGGYKTQGRIISPFGRSVAAHVRTLTQCNTVGVWNSEREISNVIAEINAEKIREQSELLVPETPRELSTAALLSPTASSSATTTLGKRRRTQVDYASLDAKMRAEEAALKTPNP